MTGVLGPVQAKRVRDEAEMARMWSLDLERALADGDLQRAADLSVSISTSLAVVRVTLGRVGVSPSVR